jgi:hypothetical protein
MIRASSTSSQTKARRTLLLIATVFALPLALSWFFALGPFQWRPGNTVNHGVLLEPSLSLRSFSVTDSVGETLSLDAISGDWFVAVLHGAECRQVCKRLWEIAGHLRIAVGRDISRVDLAMLGPKTDLPTPLEEIWLLPPDAKLALELGRLIDEPLLETALLIVDYRGYIVLMYGPDEKGPDALLDLRRLLRVSARQ